MAELLSQLPLLEKIPYLFPSAKQINFAPDSSMSGSFFFSLPDNMILKIPPETTFSRWEENWLNYLKTECGATYETIFWPTEIIKAEEISGIISPRFQATAADLLRQPLPPDQKTLSALFAAIAFNLQKLGEVKKVPMTEEFPVEVSAVLNFLASQIADQELTLLVKKLASEINRYIPTHGTLSANDAWLGNFAVDDNNCCLVTRLVDTTPFIPSANQQELNIYLQQSGIKNPKDPKIRHTLLDWGRVFVSSPRFSQEFRNKGWAAEADYLETNVLLSFKEKACQNIGSQALILGEVINTTLFAVCTCEGCIQSGMIDLMIQEAKKAIKILLENVN